MRIRDQVRARGGRVVVLCGGSGAERAVSLDSGRAVGEALLAAGFPVACLELEADALPADLNARRDIVLPLVHGTYGEDGRLSAELEALGLVYGGSDARASALAFDKALCKETAALSGLSVAPHVRLGAGERLDLEAIVAEVGLPFVLKPCCEGSSVGLMVLNTMAEALERLPPFAERALLAEAFCSGVDATVAILGDTVLGSISIHPGGGVYDYAHKYTRGMTRYAVPAELDAAVCRRMEADALEIFRACGCRDLGRVDFRVTEDGKAVFLEVNTLPGMTATSLFPMAAKAAGLSFEAVLIRWIELAMKRLEGLA